MVLYLRPEPVRLNGSLKISSKKVTFLTFHAFKKSKRPFSGLPLFSIIKQFFNHFSLNTLPSLASFLFLLVFILILCTCILFSANFECLKLLFRLWLKFYFPLSDYFTRKVNVLLNILSVS